jgi:molybdopterin converting factor small subunit
MGSLLENSWLYIAVPRSSCIFRHNANLCFSRKKRALREKKYQNPTAIYLRAKPEMQVKVHYISLVKSYTNKSQDIVNLPDGSILADLLNKIAEAYGKEFQTEVYDPTKKEMKPTFVTMVNGILMDQLQGVNTPIKDGDNVILMALMTGG